MVPIKEPMHRSALDVFRVEAGDKHQFVDPVR